MVQEKVLITGASGQLGKVLTEKLQEKYGSNNVIASDLGNNILFNGRTSHIVRPLDVSLFCVQEFNQEWKNQLLNFK